MPGEMIRYGEGEKYNGYLAAAGYVAFAPDLFQGQVVSTVDEAKKLAEKADSEWSEFIEAAAGEAVDFLSQ